MSVLLEFSIFPLDQGESVSAHVSQVIKLIRDSGVDYQLTAMGTLIETDDLGQAMALVERSSELLEKSGCNRVYATLKIDIRKGAKGRLQAKTRSIEAHIGEVSTAGHGAATSATKELSANIEEGKNDESGLLV